MLEQLTRHWWVLALRGVLAILFAVIAFSRPGVTLVALVWVWGAYAFVDGVTAAARGLEELGASLEPIRIEDLEQAAEIHRVIQQAEAAYVHEPWFESQRERRWFTEDVFRSVLRLRGMECRTRYAEAFTCTKSVILPFSGLAGTLEE